MRGDGVYVLSFKIIPICQSFELPFYPGNIEKQFRMCIISESKKICRWMKNTKIWRKICFKPEKYVLKSKLIIEIEQMYPYEWINSRKYNFKPEFPTCEKATYCRIVHVLSSFKCYPLSQKVRCKIIQYMSKIKYGKSNGVVTFCVFLYIKKLFVARD
jgi:hypothetical protein